MADEMWRAGFAAFDAAWTREHYHRRASDGGVRATFYAAGFRAGSTVAADLLAALERALTQTEADISVHADDCWVMAARAAIAKARGEASRDR